MSKTPWLDKLSRLGGIFRFTHPRAYAGYLSAALSEAIDLSLVQIIFLAKGRRPHMSHNC